MRLVTWNVNSIRARLPRLLELLGRHRPDVVCLQELKCLAEAFPHRELAEAGYRGVASCGGRWSGVAILAREERGLTASRTGIDGVTDAAQARWVEASVDGVRVASVYVPNGRAVGDPAFVDKLAFLHAVAGRAAALRRDRRGGRVVLAGDFNVAPADADVHDPAAFTGATHVTDDERAALGAVLDAGLLDAFRALHPARRQFTWWDYRAGAFHRGLGMRIDLVLCSPDLAERLTGCGIDRDFRKGPKPSDHAPLLADFARDPEPEAT